MRKLNLGLVFAASLALVAGCGGGSSSTRSLDNFTPIPQAPDFKSISGDVQGLTGVLTLGWESRTQVLTGGAFTIPLAFDSGADFVLSIVNEPFSQTCTIDSQTVFNAQDVDVVGVSISCITQNLISVSVENFSTGAALAGIDVTATWNDQGAQQTMAGVSDAQGRLTFEVPTFDGRIMVNADPVGFGEQSKVVTNTLIPFGRAARMLMQPNSTGTTFDAAVGADLAVGEVLLSIPANALADAGGSLYTGMVTAEMTVVDPSVEVEVMPGDYTSRDAGGATSPMQSYGALSVTFTGTGGEVLDLDAGQTVNINIPVAAAELVTAPAATPLFYYDPISGYWTEEGQAVLTTLPSGLRVFTGQVSHFTTWNADEEYVPVFINGCVVNTAGAPFPNVRVNATGASYLGSTRAITDSNGLFSVPVRPFSDVLITVGDLLQSGTIQASSSGADSTVSPCLIASGGSSTINLTWGANPSDLDTRLYGFSNVDSGDDFTVNFTSRSVLVNNITIDLDVDDVTGFGPEIVTLPDFPFQGVYRYAVHLFSGSGDIQSSPARVELNLRGDVTVFIPPQGTPTQCWAVFDMAVDAFANVTVTLLDSWEATDYCTSGNFPNPTD